MHFVSNVTIPDFVKLINKVIADLPSFTNAISNWNGFRDRTFLKKQIVVTFNDIIMTLLRGKRFTT